MITEVKERLRVELDLAAADPAGAPQPRLRRLRQLDAGLSALQPERLPQDRVGYGSSVVLEETGTRRRISYTLVTADVIDVEEDQVTLASPIGAALLGRKKGERIDVELPQGRRRFRIVELTTLPQLLGMNGKR
jgi:transcription elongation factor GreA